MALSVYTWLRDLKYAPVMAAVSSRHAAPADIRAYLFLYQGV
jgi:hypothetical protein